MRTTMTYALALVCGGAIGALLGLGASLLF